MNGPTAPNPQATASAQTASNQSTALSQQLLNMVNQKTPTGALTYSNTGTNSYFDPSLNKTVNLPSFTATTSYTPQQQALFDQQQKFAANSNTIGLQQQDAIGKQLATPFSYTPGDYEKWAGGTYDKLNGDTNAKQIAAQQQTLVNQGLQPGSTAYDDAMRNTTYGQDKARNDFMLNAYGTGMNTALTQRNQPINEISALTGGGQVSQPNFASTPNVGVSGTDVAGIQNNAYNQQNAAYSAKMGGLFGLGSAALSGWAMSDERLKEDIEKVGETPIEGVNVYEFRYKGSPLLQLGAMAQEVEKKVPDAVATTPSGFKAVNYKKLAQAMAA